MLEQEKIKEFLYKQFTLRRSQISLMIFYHFAIKKILNLHAILIGQMIIIK